MKNPATVYLALGSNLGERLDNLNQALHFLSEEVSISSHSAVYETPPWGVANQPRFLNQVVKGKTALTPHRLLDFIKAIEKKMGRAETYRYGPRKIDIDILLYGRRIVDTHRLLVPHPRMHERAFVLIPLADIAPNLVIPDQILSVSEMLKGLDQSGIIKIETETR